MVWNTAVPLGMAGKGTIRMLSVATRNELGIDTADTAMYPGSEPSCRGNTPTIWGANTQYKCSLSYFLRYSWELEEDELLDLVIVAVTRNALPRTLALPFLIYW